METIEGSCLEAVEDEGVSPLDLAVALGVRDGSKTDPGAHLITEFLKRGACKLGTIVCDDAISDSEPDKDAADELDGCGCRDFADGLRFWPFGEFIDGHE
jgi:hypothetical protein